VALPKNSPLRPHRGVGWLHQASPLGRFTWGWFSEVLRAGYTRQLQDDDLCPLDHEYSVEANVSVFAQYWAAELRKDNPSLVRAMWRMYRRCVVLSAPIGRPRAHPSTLFAT
jgi:hypothetical protein